MRQNSFRGLAVVGASAALILAGALAAYLLGSFSGASTAEVAGSVTGLDGLSGDSPGGAFDEGLETVVNSRREVEVDLRQFNQLIPVDAIRPIYDPQFAPGEPLSLGSLELVIGVEINGVSKAYPVGPLRRREMVNDVVGGVPVLVTW